MLPLGPNPILTSFQALRKATGGQLAWETLCYRGRTGGSEFHHSLLITPPRLLFCRRAWRPKQSSSRLSPTTPRGKKPVSFPKREKEERKQSQKEKLKLHLLCLKAQRRRDRFCTEAPLDSGEGNLCASSWKTLSAGRF